MPSSATLGSRVVSVLDSGAEGPGLNRSHQWQPRQCRGAQGPKTVKGTQSDRNYVSRLLARSECLPGGPKIIVAPLSVTTLSGNSLRQTVYTHCASVHQAAKLVAALLRVAG